MSSRIQQMESIAPWSDVLFLAAGALFMVGAAVNATRFVTDGFDPGPASAAFLLVGLIAALLGMAGLAPALSERTERLAQASLAVAAVTVVGVVVLLIWAVAEIAGLTGDPAPPVALTILFLMIVSFALFGAGVLQTGAASQIVGILLLAEAVALVLVFAIPAFVFEGSPPETWAPVIEAIQALILLGAGYSLRQDEAVAEPSSAGAVG